MADFEIIEADFQQFYNIDISKLKFRRYARLLTNLPANARMVQKYSPLKDWDWDKEMQAQILLAIDSLTTLYVNANKKKGAKKLEAPELVQPEYVKNAKEMMAQEKKKTSAYIQQDLEALFSAHNNKIKELENKGEQNRRLLQ